MCRMKLPDRIPPLSGWFLRLFQVVWWVCFAGAIFGIVQYSQAERQNTQAQLSLFSTGLSGDLTYDQMTVSPLTSAVRAAGVAPKQQLVDVDGQPLAASQDERARQLGGPDGSRLTVTLRAADGAVHDVTLVRSSDYIRQAYAGSGLTYQSAQWVIFFCGLSWAIVLGLVALILVLRRPREPVAAMLAFICVFPNVPLTGIGPPALVHSVQTALLFLLLPLGILLFPDSRLPARWTWGVVAIILLDTVTGVIAQLFPSAQLYFFNSNILFPIEFGLLAIAVIARYRLTPPGTQKQQLKFFTLGMIVYALCIAVSLALRIVVAWQVPNLAQGGLYGWNELLHRLLQAIGLGSMGLGILISLLRYRLYDAERTISRSVAIGALTLLLIGIFAGTERLAEVMGEEWFGQDLGAFAGGLGAAVAAICIAPLHKRLDLFAERWFQSDLTKLRHDYPHLVADLRETMSPREIAETTLGQVVPTVRAQRGAVVMDGEMLAEWDVSAGNLSAWLTGHPQVAGLEQDKADPLFPTRLLLGAPGHGNIGLLLLGPRPDGSPMGKDEREALSAIADPVARALTIAHRRQQHEQQQSGLIAGLAERLARLEERMATLAAARAAKP